MSKYRGRWAAPPFPPRKAGRVKRLFLRAVPQERRDVDVLFVGAELGLGLVLVLLAGEEGLDALLGLLGLAGLVAEAGGDDGDLHLALHLLVADDSEDDVGAGVGRSLHDLGGLLDLVEG